jgi:SEC-C motif-containing protein
MNDTTIDTIDKLATAGTNVAACPCGSGLDYNECCHPYISGEKLPPTAEALMRSRYSAYAKREVDYIVNTCSPNGKKEEKIDVKETRAWAEKSTWLGLTIVNVDKGGADDEEGVVEFKALFEQDGARQTHHERAFFEKISEKVAGSIIDHWYYARGKMLIETVVRSEPKIGRNEPCPCGSGKKYKHCCGK